MTQMNNKAYEVKKHKSRTMNSFKQSQERKRIKEVFRHLIAQRWPIQLTTGCINEFLQQTWLADLRSHLFF